MSENRESWISSVVRAVLWVVPAAILISFLASDHPGGARGPRTSVLRRSAECDSSVSSVGAVVFAAEDYYDV